MNRNEIYFDNISVEYLIINVHHKDLFKYKLFSNSVVYRQRTLSIINDMIDKCLSLRPTYVQTYVGHFQTYVGHANTGQVHAYTQKII